MGLIFLSKMLKDLCLHYTSNDSDFIQHGRTFAVRDTSLERRSVGSTSRFNNFNFLSLSIIFTTDVSQQLDRFSSRQAELNLSNTKIVAPVDEFIDATNRS